MRAEAAKPRPARRQLPTREDQLKTLKSGGTYDVLIIGGGATGAGCALDACTRGKNNNNTKKKIIIYNKI